MVLSPGVEFLSGSFRVYASNASALTLPLPLPSPSPPPPAKKTPLTGQSVKQGESGRSATSQGVKTRKGGREFSPEKGPETKREK